MGQLLFPPRAGEEEEGREDSLAGEQFCKEEDVHRGGTRPHNVTSANCFLSSDLWWEDLKV